MGGKATVSVAVEKLPPLFKERVKASLATGDVSGAKALLQQALQSGEVKGELSLAATAALEGEAGLNLKAGGVGGQVDVEGGVSSEVPIGSVECTVDWQGVKLSGELGKLEGAVSWERLRNELPASAE
jgi:hypothetical protein